MMADKGFILFDKCAAKCVHSCPQEKRCTFLLEGTVKYRHLVHLCPLEEEGSSSSWEDSKMYTSGTITNSQRTPTKINKNGAIVKVRVLVEQAIL